MTDISQNNPSPGGQSALEQPQSVLEQIANVSAAHPNQVYFNNFLNNIGPSDISSVLMREGVIVGVLHMSYTTAKTFALMLGQAISQLEDLAGQKIMTTNHILTKMNEQNEKKDEAGN